jgi:hypothetical protein
MNVKPLQGNRILSELGAMFAVTIARIWPMLISNRVVSLGDFDEKALAAIALEATSRSSHLKRG